jgi:hypothetical protein
VIKLDLPVRHRFVARLSGGMGGMTVFKLSSKRCVVIPRNSCQNRHVRVIGPAGFCLLVAFWLPLGLFGYTGTPFQERGNPRESTSAASLDSHSGAHSWVHLFQIRATDPGRQEIKAGDITMFLGTESHVDAAQNLLRLRDIAGGEAHARG